MAAEVSHLYVWAIALVNLMLVPSAFLQPDIPSTNTRT